MSKLLKSLYQKNKRQWVETLVWSLVTIFVVVAKHLSYSKSHSLTSIWMDNAWIAPMVYLAIQLTLAFMAVGIDGHNSQSEGNLLAIVAGG